VQGGDKQRQPILLVGNQGTNVGNLIKGFSRRGGKWARQTHSRHTTVGIVDEFRTSQTCEFCYSQVIRLISNRGRTVNGSFQCLNKKGPAVNKGLAIQSKDTMAAFLLGFILILNMKPRALTRHEWRLRAVDVIYWFFKPPRPKSYCALKCSLFSLVIFFSINNRRPIFIWEKNIFV
jgi:hypothetical protein